MGRTYHIKGRMNRKGEFKKIQTVKGSDSFFFLKKSFPVNLGFNLINKFQSQFFLQKKKERKEVRK